MANRMHRQGLDGPPRKNLTFLTSECGSSKKWCAIAHENRRNEGYAHFGARLTFQMGRTSHHIDEVDMCKCGYYCRLKTSRTPLNPGRRFFGCKSSKVCYFSNNNCSCCTI